MNTFADFSRSEKKQIRVFIDDLTVPSSSFENAVINKIVGLNKKAEEWRFEKNIICANCHRHLSILDYFLNGILHHPLEFIQNELCPDFAQKGQCAHDVDPKEIDRIDVVDNEMAIICCNCGTTNLRIMYTLYAHPGCKGSIVRMSTFHFDHLRQNYLKPGKKR